MSIESSMAATTRHKPKLGLQTKSLVAGIVTHRTKWAVDVEAGVGAGVTVAVRRWAIASPQNLVTYVIIISVCPVI